MYCTERRYSIPWYAGTRVLNIETTPAFCCKSFFCTIQNPVGCCWLEVRLSKGRQPQSNGANEKGATTELGPTPTESPLRDHEQTASYEAEEPHRPTVYTSGRPCGYQIF